MLVGEEKGFVQADGREVERQPAAEMHATLHRVDKLGDVCVAGLKPEYVFTMPTMGLDSASSL